MWLLPKPGSPVGQGGLRWPGVLVSRPPRATIMKPIQTRVLGGWELGGLGTSDPAPGSPAELAAGEVRRDGV